MAIQVPLRPGVKPLPLNGVTVMVNPGHGERKSHGIANGAVRKIGRKTIKEMDLNDKVAQNVKRKLELLGAKVVLLDNTPVKQIPAIEDKIKPNIFVSIHQNSGNKIWSLEKGEGTYAFQPEGEKLAKCINDHFKADSTISNNGNHKKRASQLKVLKADPSIPAMLMECGYMSNKKELKILNTQDYQNKEAQFIVDGIRDYLNIKKKEAKKAKTVEYAEKKIKFPLLFQKKISEKLNPWLKIEKPEDDI